MTLTTAHPAPSDADVEQLLRTTSVALADLLRCVLDDDRCGARRVWRDRARRRCVAAVHDRLERECLDAPRDEVGFRHLMCRLQFIQDLLVINVLLDRLAELVTRGQVGTVSPQERRDLRLLREASSHRLRQLASGATGPWDTTYRRCGEDLHTVLLDLGSAGDCSLPGPLCGRLAATVLAASKHAAGAA